MPETGPEQSGLFVFGVKMNQRIASTAFGNNGESTPHDLFALTDEQILEIEPEAQDAAVTRDPGPVTREEKPDGQAQASSELAHGELRNAPGDEKTNVDARATANRSSTDHGTRATDHGPRLYLVLPVRSPGFVHP